MEGDCVVYFLKAKTTVAPLKTVGILFLEVRSAILTRLIVSLMLLIEQIDKTSRDCASRDLTPDALLSTEVSWKGPSSLYEPILSWNV